jgi:hypothetical protein
MSGECRKSSGGRDNLLYIFASDEEIERGLVAELTSCTGWGACIV